MRSTKKIMSLLAALLLVVLPAISVAGSTTTASVAFEAGGLSWGELDGSGLDNMNLNFGTRYLPTQGVTYDTTNAPHSIQVEDARETVDGWNVKVSMSAFAAAGHTSFDGMVTLANGTADNAYTSAITPIEITSGLGNANVATSQAEAGRGIFTIKWNAASDVQLSLSEAEALKVETASYSAELIWTLAATPSL